MARSTPSVGNEAAPAESQGAASEGEPTSGDGQGAAGGEAIAVAEPPAASPEPEAEPGPAVVEAEAEVEAEPVEAEPDVEAPELALPDPMHLIGDRNCPVCDGAGVIPFGVLQSPRFRPCDECGGIGQVLTGSLKPESSVFDCPGCEGAGYKQVEGAGIAGDRPAPAVGPDGPPPWPNAVYDHVLGNWT